MTTAGRAVACGLGEYAGALGLGDAALADAIGNSFDPAALLTRIAAPIAGMLAGEGRAERPLVQVAGGTRWSVMCIRLRGRCRQAMAALPSALRARRGWAGGGQEAAGYALRGRGLVCGSQP